jgi:4-amino-4-deoxy-L-arabinose transferase-like glycosyltransferase
MKPVPVGRPGEWAWRAGPRAGPILVGAVALVSRLAVVAWASARFPPVEDGHYYDVLAQRLASGAGYTWLWPDGTVTYVAHYPAGYPAAVALAYLVVGVQPIAGMLVNALLGAAGAVAAHRLADGAHVPAWRPLAAGLCVALHPALVAYTPAYMTEGVTASLLLIAGALAVGARSDRHVWRWVAAAGAVIGLATLVRPPSLLVAPAVGALALRAGRPLVHRALAGALATAVALACVAPWTARNCVRMHRCALVSLNGGWNLLIGAHTTSGGWAPIDVPPECATVWDEAEKDVCFERAAEREIAAAPGSWIGRASAKLAMTFDSIGAGGWYLHASNASAFGEGAKRTLAVVETVVCRLVLLAGLVLIGRANGSWMLPRKLVALLGAVFAVTVHAWVGYVALAACVGLRGRRALAVAPLGMPLGAVVVASTVVVHAVFFGAGRYGLVALPFVAVCAVAGTREG